MKILIGLMLIFGTIAMFIWNSVPRLTSDLWHSREFVPAQNFTITDYKCTNWNVFMFNECTATFVSRQGGESRQITDWRFGWAPRDPVHLVQWRDDASAVTTDVSLRTLWNRLLVAVTLVLFGVLLAMGLIVNAFGSEDAPVAAPVAAPGREPAPQPIARSTFGKRHA
jgi:fumarate reductase subunit D